MLAFLLIASVASVAVHGLHDFDSGLVGDCSYDMLTACDMGITLFVNDKVMPVTEDEKKARCENQTKSLECLNAFGAKCLQSVEKGLFMVLIDAVKEEVGSRCTVGTHDYDNYKNNIECLNSVPAASVCMRTAANGLKWISETVPLETQIKTSCCVLPSTLECVKKAIIPTCGKEGFEAAEHIVNRYFTELVEVACVKHKKLSCSELPQIPQEWGDQGQYLHLLNPLVKLAHVATRYP